MSALISSPLPPVLTKTNVLLKESQGHPWWSSGYDSVLSLCRGLQVRSLPVAEILQAGWPSEGYGGGKSE